MSQQAENLTTADMSSTPPLRSAPTPYPYTPLESKTIRLLTIHAGKKREDAISTSLQTASFAEGPKYEALSYAWHRSIADDARTDGAQPYHEYFGKVTPPRAVHSSALMDELGWSRYNDLRPNFSNEPATYYVCQFGGVPKPTEITCDGLTMAIGGELHKALQFLRREDEDRVLWVGMSMQFRPSFEMLAEVTCRVRKELTFSRRHMH
jgi:hypothetical protein